MTPSELRKQTKDDLTRHMQNLKNDLANEIITREEFERERQKIKAEVARRMFAKDTP